MLYKTKGTAFVEGFKSLGLCSSVYLHSTPLELMDSQMAFERRDSETVNDPFAGITVYHLVLSIHELEKII